MKNTGTLKVTTPADHEIAMTRVFDAPRSQVFEALTKPELLKRWFFGPPGWSLAVCEIDLKVGGAYPNTIVVLETGAPVLTPWRGKLAALLEAWYPGEALVTTVMVEHDGRTTLTLTVRYESREARDAVLKTPMEHGVAVGYDRLAELLAR